MVYRNALYFFRNVNAYNCYIFVKGKGKSAEERATEKTSEVKSTFNRSKPNADRKKTNQSTPSNTSASSSQKAAAAKPLGKARPELLQTGEEGSSTLDEQNVEMLMTMGFDRQSVIKALEASNHNINIAAEYLLEV